MHEDMTVHAMVLSAVTAALLVPFSTSQLQNVSCCHGAVRLANGNVPIPHEGRVEICYEGDWKTACNHYLYPWGNCEAAVVCAQLGYAREGAQFDQKSFGHGTESILEIVACQGTEVGLVNCYLRDFRDYFEECLHSDDVGVRCVPNSNNCFEGDVRLTNSSYLNEGRVEMCTNGVWGTVCPNNWSTLDTSVVCKQLGYSEYGATTTTVGNGHLPSYFGNVTCTGNEQRLIDCPHQKSTFTCAGCSSVGISCIYETAYINIVVDEWNTANISWLIPHFVKRNSTLLSYSLSCSTTEADALVVETQNTTEQIQLEPHTTYQCCVSVMSETNLWTPSCKIITSHEEAPSAPPTNISWFALSKTSVHLFWLAPPAESQNGIIRNYQVKIYDLNSTQESLKTYLTENQFLTVDNLMPNVGYVCVIAAHTNRKGPYSEPINFTITYSEDYDCIPKVVTDKLYSRPNSTSEAEVTVVMYTFAITSGALLFIVIVTAAILGAVYFRRGKSHKTQTRKEMVDNVMYEAEKSVAVNVIYETIDEPKADTLNTPANQELSDKKQSFILIQNLINSNTFAHNSEARALNNAQPTVTSASEDGNYQPMIPPRTFYKDKEYQCLEEHGVIHLESENTPGSDILSPIEERGVIHSESENTPGSDINSNSEMNTRSAYQSLIKDSEIRSTSGDYQTLNEQ